MVKHWKSDLADKQAQRKLNKLHRVLHTLNHCAKLVVRDGSVLINLGSNDYLGLATHEKIKSTMKEAIDQFGCGAGASALVTGHLNVHEQLESAFAIFKQSQAALFCPTGYMANMATITSLVSEADTIFMDKLNHASLIDGARLSGATIRTFPHLGYEKLQRLLERSFQDKPTARRMIITDSVFSMDGDVADLPLLCELRDKYQAILMIDEAHGTGVLGARGTGLAEHQGVLGDIDVTVSTCGKGLGVLGGVITGDRVIIDEIINAGRAYIYTTSPPPALAAGVLKALEILNEEPERRQQLNALTNYLRKGLQARRWKVPDDPTPIIPLIVGESETALHLSKRLEQDGFLVPAIRPPTVSVGGARLRISMRADLTIEELDRLLEVIGECDAKI